MMSFQCSKKSFLSFWLHCEGQGDEEPYAAKFSVTSITKSNQTEPRTTKQNGLFFCGLVIGKEFLTVPPTTAPVSSAELEAGQAMCEPTETHQMPPKPTGCRPWAVVAFSGLAPRIFSPGALLDEHFEKGERQSFRQGSGRG